MATNKERMELLEVGLGAVQDGLQRLEIGMADKFQHVEMTLNRLLEVLFANQATPHVHHNRDPHPGDRQIVSSKLAKLEFPRFVGDDHTEWPSREANQWWQWVRRTYQNEDRVITWLDFEDELWACFGPSDCENFDKDLSRIRQLGSLRDYQKEFERLGNQVRGWTQKALVDTFMGGLKPEISDAIRLFKPQTLKEAIGLARMRGDQLQKQRKFSRSVHPPVALTSDRNNPTSATPIRRLSWDEMQRRRAQGLCFNCNEHFTAGHRCQEPSLLLLEGHDDEADDNNDSVAQMILDNPHNSEITLHALSGWATPKTMRVEATIGVHTVITLIDSGSTHNFISKHMAEVLRLPALPTQSFIVKVANGEQLQCQDRFDKVPISIQGVYFSLTLYSLPLTGLDLVLGIQWLERLGSVICNWKKLTMDFTWDNQPRRLVGVNGHPIETTSFKKISKALRPEAGALAL
ncbi:hypothetical protein F0562_019440 [Nyssa sinensis]|uniref:Retrotransposon gag domain-containing protein n=1 Tax=Nyssa sinensis TaxID=561372 RepID=A0A5J5BNH5_9ASTE|nr:hypothetical protein F0562_019440 [Nyssa sinensis]